MAEKYEGYSSWIISTHIIVERGVHGQISRSAGHAALTERKESSGGVIKKFQDAANAHFKLRSRGPIYSPLSRILASKIIFVCCVLHSPIAYTARPFVERMV